MNNQFNLDSFNEDLLHEIEQGNRQVIQQLIIFWENPENVQALRNQLYQQFQQILQEHARLRNQIGQRLNYNNNNNPNGFFNGPSHRLNDNDNANNGLIVDGQPHQINNNQQDQSRSFGSREHCCGF